MICLYRRHTNHAEKKVDGVILESAVRMRSSNSKGSFKSSVVIVNVVFFLFREITNHYPLDHLEIEAGAFNDLSALKYL